VYTKTIFNGSYLEQWQYEKAPKYHPVRRKRRVIERRQEGFVDLKRRRLDNLRRTRKGFLGLVSINSSRGDRSALLTLTMVSIVDVATASKAFNEFSQTLRRLFGNGFRYIGVPEFQKRGAVHYHVIVWGLPDRVIENERDTRFLQHCWARGFLDCIPTDGSEKIAGYLAKYMQKAMFDERLGYKRAYLASRNVMRPVLFKAAAVVANSRAVLGCDLELIGDRSFGTDWLGMGRYLRYKVIPIEGVAEFDDPTDTSVEVEL